MTHRLLAALAVFLLGLSNVALASADLEFDFSDIYSQHGFGSMSGSDGSMQYYLDETQTGTGASLSITGWQARANTRNFRNRTDKLRNFGSLGHGLDHNESGWQEGIDSNGRFDLMIFEFDDLVSLDRVDMGWVGSDADITVMAFTGAGAPTLDNGTFRYDQNSSKGMTNLGWELVGHYDENSMSIDVNETGLMSSFWAIGAFTSAIVDASRTYGTPDEGDDYFTLRRIAASTVDAAVSEPGVFALMLGGILLLVLRRRGPA